MEVLTSTPSSYLPKGNNQIRNNNAEQDETDETEQLLRSLVAGLESRLRLAKKAHLACGEVLLPPNLLSRVALDALLMGESEPCGLRGARLVLHFRDLEIGTLQLGPFPPTFQLDLTLREEQAPWYERLLSNALTSKGKGSLVLSSGYVLAKRKLYR